MKDLLDATDALWDKFTSSRILLPLHIDAVLVKDIAGQYMRVSDALWTAKSEMLQLSTLWDELRKQLDSGK